MSNIDSFELRSKAVIPPLDLEICIQLDQNNGYKLFFSLHSRVAGYIFANFGFVQLNASPQEKMQSLTEKLSNMTGRAPKTVEQKSKAINKLERIGTSLWKELIPDELKQEYWKFKHRVRTVLVVSDDPWIPWEMIKPFKFDANGKRQDDPFWCQQFSISRWLSKHGAPVYELNSGVARSVAPQKSNLTSLKEEVSSLEQLHSHDSAFTILEPLCNCDDVIDWFENANFSILHFACHGTFDTLSPNESAITLSDGPLCPSDIQTQFIGSRSRPLVFINACHGGRLEFSFTRLGGWAIKLLEARVGIFIGAMWEVTDELALNFTCSFYRKLIKEHATVAEAFKQAREEIRQLAPYDSTWLAYVLYADPNSCIQDFKNKRN